MNLMRLVLGGGSMSENWPVVGAPTQSNPYAPPSADLAELPAGVDANAVAVRLAHLGRENAIKLIAWINLLVAVIWSPAAIGTVVLLVLTTLRVDGFERFFPPVPHPGLAIAGLTLFHGGAFSLNVALFLGLRRLRAWARWTMVGLATVSLIVLCVYLFVAFNGAETNWKWYLGTLVTWGLTVAAVFYVLLTRPSGAVFTREYRNVVARTRGLQI